MILSETAIREVVYRNTGWLFFLSEGEQLRPIGSRPLPPIA
jgi:hypothetical protein